MYKSIKVGKTNNSNNKTDLDDICTTMCCLYEFSLGLVSDAILILESLKGWRSSKIVFANGSLEEKLGYDSKELNNEEAHNIIEDLIYCEDAEQTNSDNRYNNGIVGTPRSGAQYKGSAVLICKGLDKRTLSFNAYVCSVPPHQSDKQYYVLMMKAPTRPRTPSLHKYVFRFSTFVFVYYCYYSQRKPTCAEL